MHFPNPLQSDDYEPDYAERSSSATANYDDDLPDRHDEAEALDLYFEELADYSDSASRAHEEGWF